MSSVKQKVLDVCYKLFSPMKNFHEFGSLNTITRSKRLNIG